MLWVTITIVTSSESSVIVSSMRRVDVGSSAEHGSSISRMSGWTASDRAMQSRCCCPPERSPPGRCNRSLTSRQSPALVRQVSMSSARSPRGTLVPVSLSPAVTLSAIVMAGKGLGFWNTIPIRRRASVSRWLGS